MALPTAKKLAGRHGDIHPYVFLCPSRAGSPVYVGRGEDRLHPAGGMILEEHPKATADRAIKILEACQVEEEDFFCHVTHKTWDIILHDIRKAHENDNESAPDTTPADELIREVQKAMQSPGDRVQQFTEMFCKAFQLKYKRLSQEERSLLLKKLFKKSPLIKQSGMNFRRRPWK